MGCLAVLSIFPESDRLCSHPVNAINDYREPRISALACQLVLYRANAPATGRSAMVSEVPSELKKRIVPMEVLLESVVSICHHLELPPNHSSTDLFQPIAFGIVPVLQNGEGLTSA